MKKVNYNTIIIILLAVIIGFVAYLILRGSKPEINSITINKHSVSILVGTTQQLNVDILPIDVEDKTVIWESSNPSVVTVSNGIVMGNSDGNAIITVRTEDGKVYDKCSVRVIKKEADRLEIDEPKVEIRINDVKELSVIIEPLDLKNEKILWVSDDENIVTVEDGLLTGINSGKTTVKAIYGEKEAICEVKVVKPVSSLSIDSEITVDVGKTKTLIATITPEESSGQELDWESSNPNIVSVSNGDITGIREGEAIVTAMIDGKIATTKVNVIIPVTNISLDKNTIKMKVGTIDSLKATVSPNNATNKDITWTSSNNSVAVVQDGKVTGIKAGEVEITASSSNGVKSTSKIIVYYPSITDNSKYYSGYTTSVTYNSETLKYRITKKGKDNFVLVWVENANKQWNSALPKIGKRFKPADIISQEINNNGYRNKGLVATNGSAFWDKWGDYPTSAFVISKGTIVRDIVNKDHPWSYGFVGITKDGILKSYAGFNSTPSNNINKKETVLDEGIRNIFTVFNELISASGKILKSNIRVKFTGLCQINENNFVIYSGESLTFEQAALRFKDFFGCRVAFRFDGGGSTALYYKTSSMSSAKSIRSGRDLPDMMYFVEQ